ncbi:hypothetical protein DY000_02049444 [Brassica cretica]|uniref:F-box domain-containing protein n=1 Tax=Brassica cretica TaxID=69181 RepID=A0ABQ7EU59_BRACR|nr:hypothetical protein DY000_02049444 [Brassica cretica]
MKKLLLVLGLGGDIEKLNLASLPPSMIHQILSNIYKSHFVNDWIKEVNDVRTFRLRCYHLDGMMNLAFSIDDRGLVHNYAGFTREHVDRMSHTITSLELMQ